MGLAHMASGELSAKMTGDCYLIVGLSCHSGNIDLQKRQKLFTTMNTVYALFIFSLRVSIFRMRLQLELLSYFIVY